SETAVQTRAHYEILSISLSLLHAFSPTLVMGTNQIALIMERREAVAATDLLDIVVPDTTPRLTRLALKKAEELASEIPSRIRILRMQKVPFPVDLRQPTVSLPILRADPPGDARHTHGGDHDLFDARSGRDLAE